MRLILIVAALLILPSSCFAVEYYIQVRDDGAPNANDDILPNKIREEFTTARFNATFGHSAEKQQRENMIVSYCGILTPNSAADEVVSKHGGPHGCIVFRITCLP